MAENGYRPLFDSIKIVAKYQFIIYALFLMLKLFATGISIITGPINIFNLDNGIFLAAGQMFIMLFGFNLFSLAIGIKDMDRQKRTEFLYYAPRPLLFTGLAAFLAFASVVISSDLFIHPLKLTVLALIPLTIWVNFYYWFNSLYFAKETIRIGPERDSMWHKLNSLMIMKEGYKLSVSELKQEYAAKVKPILSKGKSALSSVKKKSHAEKENIPKQ